MKLADLIILVELLTFIVGLINYKKFGHTYLKYFLFLLGFIVIIEFIVWGLKWFYGYYVQNHFIYNVSTSIQYIFYYTLYIWVFANETYKKIVKGFLILYAIAVIINFTFAQRLTVDGPFHSYTFTLGAVLLITSIGLFFAEMLKSEKILHFRTQLMFWISIGLFVFYTAIIPVVLSINFLPTGIEPMMLRAILFVLNIMMYGCFSIGFIVSGKYSH